MAYQEDCIDHGKRGFGMGYATHSKRIDGKQPLMHRLAYATAHGLNEATMGGVVMHTCDNARCINAAHLVLGSQQDNIADRQAKGRQARGATWGCPRKDDRSTAKLTSEVVAHCRAVYQPRHKQFGQRALARQYGVSHGVMGKALQGATWA